MKELIEFLSSIWNAVNLKKATYNNDVINNSVQLPNLYALSGIWRRRQQTGWNAAWLMLHTIIMRDVCHISMWRLFGIWLGALVWSQRKIHIRTVYRKICAVSIFIGSNDIFEARHECRYLTLELTFEQRILLQPCANSVEIKMRDFLYNK